MFKKHKKNPIVGYFNPEIHTEDNPLVLRSYTTKGLPTMVRWFVKFVAKWYGLNKYGASEDIIEEIRNYQNKM